MSIADGSGRSRPRSAVEESDIEVPGQSLGQVHRAHQVAEPHGVLAVEEQAWSRHRSSVVRRRPQARAVARTPSRSLIVGRSSRLDRAGRPLDEECGRGVPEQVVERRRTVVRRQQGLAGGLGRVGVDLVPGRGHQSLASMPPSSAPAGPTPAWSRSTRLTPLSWTSTFLGWRSPCSRTPGPARRPAARRRAPRPAAPRWAGPRTPGGPRPPPGRGPAG